MTVRPLVLFRIKACSRCRYEVFILIQAQHKKQSSLQSGAGMPLAVHHAKPQLVKNKLSNSAASPAKTKNAFFELRFMLTLLPENKIVQPWPLIQPTCIIFVFTQNTVPTFFVFSMKFWANVGNHCWVLIDFVSDESNSRSMEKETGARPHTKNGTYSINCFKTWKFDVKSSEFWTLLFGYIGTVTQPRNWVMTPRVMHLPGVRRRHLKYIHQCLRSVSETLIVFRHSLPRSQFIILHKRPYFHPL